MPGRKALVFIDYDMVIRHFVLSGAFRELEKRFAVRYVIHRDSTSPKQGVNVDVDTLKLGDVLRFELPRARMGSWDHLFCTTSLFNQRGTANYQRRYQQILDTRPHKLVRLYRILSQPGLFHIARPIMRAVQGIYAPLEALLRAEKPDLVLHPSVLSGYFINELTQACPRLGIPLVLLMNSWDNPSTKAMNTQLPDRLVVWGPQTRKHAIEYMKMPAERVLEFGAPQFEVYRDPIAESDAELRAMFKVPAGVPIILYAGVSKSVNETAHLEALEAAIASGAMPPAHVIYRPHPWRGGLVAGEKNFYDVPFKHVGMDPFMADYYKRVADKPDQGFDMADYRVTARLLRLVSGIISPLSTMLLEAAIHGLPMIMFWPDGAKGVAGPIIELGRRLPHFKEFWGPEGIQVCTQGDALSEACRKLLTEHQTQAVRDGLRAHARNYVALEGPRYGERLADLAEQLTADRVARAA